MLLKFDYRVYQPAGCSQSPGGVNMGSINSSTPHMWLVFEGQLHLFQFPAGVDIQVVDCQIRVHKNWSPYVGRAAKLLAGAT